jgi:predicted RNA methylase
VDESHVESAETARSLIERGLQTPSSFRGALLRVPPNERDAWLDCVFGLGELPDDGPELPRGCVPYLPCSVDVLLRVAEQAPVRASDVFVEVGAGVGRAAALVHLLTGASVVGIEIQSELVRASRDLVTRLLVSRVSCVEGDAVKLTGFVSIGSVFFLYCPFSGERLAKVVADLEPIARTKMIRVCCVDLPPLACPWLTLEPAPLGDLAIYRSTLHDDSFASRGEAASRVHYAPVRDAYTTGPASQNALRRHA